MCMGTTEKLPTIDRDRVSVNVRLERALYDLVKAHAEDMREQSPGVTVSLGDAVRALLHLGLSARATRLTLRRGALTEIQAIAERVRAAAPGAEVSVSDVIRDLLLAGLPPEGGDGGTSA